MFQDTRALHASALDLIQNHLLSEPERSSTFTKRMARVYGSNRLSTFVTPSHQFPLGVTMKLEQRLALLQWAQEVEAWIIEDDYDSEYRFSTRPVEALQGLDRANRVIYLGSFSKVLFPSLRLGYMIVPAALMKFCIAAQRFQTTHPPILEQMALADFFTE